MSAAARSAGATGDAAIPACRRMAPGLLVCVSSVEDPQRVVMMQELTAAGSSLDAALAAARAQLEPAWAAKPARTFRVEGVEGRYFVRSAGDGFDAAALLRPELLAQLVSAEPVVAVPEDGTFVWWVPGDADFDKMVAVGVRRMTEASAAPVSAQIYRYTGTEWSVWGEVRGAIDLPIPAQPAPSPPPGP